ncbi:MlaD family protein [Granulibacter bethesdensis]|uniref:MlaD family protein n=1 Tax=Granulibacter bethesdensis TaxID=364410 RepID=UPI0003F1E632|nr:MlaD family protein [Granulibacter bethesdensis]AHJ66114.1 ABC transporter substrate-binding protein [Granulibacter bethesdensis CGDNIH4]
MMQHSDPSTPPGTTVRPLYGRRYTDEWVGFLVLACIAVFAGAVIEAGFLRDWLKPPGELRILLPQTGVGGLSPGADVEVMGIHAGMIRRMKLNADGEMYALAEIDPQAEPFIRQDSKATIKLRYAVAGAAFVSLTRGTGQPLDWNYAVLSATTDQNPMEMLSSTITDIRKQALPLLHNAQMITENLNAILKNIREGKGNAGRLLTDDTLVKEAESSLASLQQAMARLDPIVEHADGLLASTNVVLNNMRSATGNLSKASKDLPGVMQNVSGITKDIPPLVLQARATARDLQKLIEQVRSLWILGGSGTPPADMRRLPPSAVQP